MLSSDIIYELNRMIAMPVCSFVVVVDSCHIPCPLVTEHDSTCRLSNLLNAKTNQFEK